LSLIEKYQDDYHTGWYLRYEVISILISKFLSVKLIEFDNKTDNDIDLDRSRSHILIIILSGIYNGLMNWKIDDEMKNHCSSLWKQTKLILG
jgi:hypothetical protein